MVKDLLSSLLWLCYDNGNTPASISWFRNYSKDRVQSLYRTHISFTLTLFCRQYTALAGPYKSHDFLPSPDIKAGTWGLFLFVFEKKRRRDEVKTVSNFRKYMKPYHNFQSNLQFRTSTGKNKIKHLFLFIIYIHIIKPPYILKATVWKNSFSSVLHALKIKYRGGEQLFKSFAVKPICLFHIVKNDVIC